MSASPTIAASSAKRPLEEPSSPAGPNEQPEAKRPALDKFVKDDHQTAEDISIARGIYHTMHAQLGLQSSSRYPLVDIATDSSCQRCDKRCSRHSCNIKVYLSDHLVV